MRSILPVSVKAEFTTYWQGPLDSRNVNPETLEGFGLFPWEICSDNKWWKRPLKKGEVACSISHWLCWRKASETDDSLFLFLEDDVCFIPEFSLKLEIGILGLNDYDPHWNLLYLGRVPLYPDKSAFNGIVKPGYSHCTYAYILTKPAIKKILETSFEKDIIPVDEFLPAMYIDHPREDVRKRYSKILSAYAFEPQIVSQLPKSVAGSDTEDSDFYDAD